MGKGALTKVVGEDFAVAEAASGALGDEVDAVGSEVGLGLDGVPHNVVGVPSIHQGVSEHKQPGSLGLALGEGGGAQQHKEQGQGEGEDRGGTVLSSHAER